MRLGHRSCGHGMRRAAFLAGHAHTLGQDLRIILALLIGGALAKDLSFLVQIADHEKHDLTHLRIADGLLGLLVQRRKALDPVLLHQIQQLQLGA